MKLIKADHDGRVAIPGVPGPVRRPVNIDRTQTGFANLRSLRVYRFDAASIIDGHAEEDEVFVIVLSGSIEFTVSGDESGGPQQTFTLSTPNEFDGAPCVAYLPPLAAYRLIPKTEADVAYARATPASGPPSKAFTASGSVNGGGVTLLLEEQTYAQRLRLRLLYVNAAEDDVDFRPTEELEPTSEALVHVRSILREAAIRISGGDGDSLAVGSWDTAAIAPGDGPTLHVPKGSLALILVVAAI